MAILCLGSWAFNRVLCRADFAFEGLHEGRTWVITSGLADEAHQFLRHHFAPTFPKLARSRGPLRHFEWEDPYNIKTGLLYALFLEEEVALQLLVGRCSTLPLEPHPVGIESVFPHVFGNYSRCHAVCRMLEAGEISPSRYRELRAHIMEHFPEDRVRGRS